VAYVELNRCGICCAMTSNISVLLWSVLFPSSNENEKAADPNTEPEPPELIQAQAGTTHNTVSPEKSVTNTALVVVEQQQQEGISISTFKSSEENMSDVETSESRPTGWHKVLREHVTEFGSDYANGVFEIVNKMQLKGITLEANCIPCEVAPFDVPPYITYVDFSEGANTNWTASPQLMGRLLKDTLEEFTAGRAGYDGMG
jgi:hypothetical protein